jgi:hypothetical protein
MTAEKMAMASEYCMMGEEIKHLKNELESMNKRNRRLVEEMNKGGIVFFF